jgi:hypothetical protein
VLDNNAKTISLFRTKRKEMRRRRGHGHQYNTLLIPNVMKYTIVQNGRTNTILLFTIEVNRQNSGQKIKRQKDERRSAKHYIEH